MANCARCSAPGADLFTTSGDLICRFCFNTEQNAQADARAHASLQESAPEGLRVAPSGALPPTPGKLIGSGLFIIGFAVVFAVGTLVLFDTIYPIWVGLLVLAGFANLARGLALRRR